MRADAAIGVFSARIPQELDCFTGQALEPSIFLWRDVALQQQETAPRALAAAEFLDLVANLLYVEIKCASDISGEELGRGDLLGIDGDRFGRDADSEQVA